MRIVTIIATVGGLLLAAALLPGARAHDGPACVLMRCGVIVAHSR